MVQSKQPQRQKIIVMTIFWIGLEMFTMCRENLTEMGFEKPKQNPQQNPR